VVEAYTAYSMRLTTTPEMEFDQVFYKFLHSNYQDKLQEELVMSFFEGVMALQQVEATLPPITRRGYAGVEPLNRDIVDVLSAAGGQGLVVLELCAGIMASTEAVIRSEDG
jgi:hypothetical protein